MEFLGAEQIAAIQGGVGRVLEALAEEGDVRTGGYCTMFYYWSLDQTAYTMYGLRVGTVPEEKKEDKRHLSAEKALRLSLHSEHKLSWESRDEAQRKWGGAVRGHACILSFSGLPPYADEAAMLLALIAMGELTLEEADRLAQISENVFYQTHFSNLIEH